MNSQKTERAALRMANALAVFILDPKLNAWLAANDPKALQQATEAVNDYRPSMIASGRPRTIAIYNSQTHRAGQRAVAPYVEQMVRIWPLTEEGAKEAELQSTMSGLRFMAEYYTRVAATIRNAMQE